MRRKRGFAPGITEPVTIYPYYISPDTGKEICVRCVLNGCFWDESASASFGKSGQQTKYSAVIYIPYAEDITGRKYISPEDWYNLPTSDLDSYWTFDPLKLPLAVKGDNPYEFEWELPDSVNRAAVQELEFQKSNSGVLRVTEISERLFGSENMHHIVLRC